MAYDRRNENRLQVVKQQLRDFIKAPPGSYGLSSRPPAQEPCSSRSVSVGRLQTSSGPQY